MKSKFKIYFLIFSLLPLYLFAQEDIIIGNKYSLHSDILNEERPYWVYLPPRYNDADFGKANYPVIYLLDGDTNFYTLVAVQKSFTRGMYNNMPECIIVGIPNTDRTRDLTPSKSSMKHNGKDMFTNSGGGENFTHFLADELRPTIDSLYRTNGYNILVGHSFGGLFAMNTLVQHTDLFNAYVVLDPSLWWDNRKVYNEAEAIWQTKDFGKRGLYIAMAKDEDRADDEQKHSKTIHEFCTTILLPTTKNNLNAYWKYYEGENHGTILTSGTFDAFRTLFEGIELPVKKIPDNPELINEYYTKLSSRMGFTFVPDETLVDNLGKYALSVEKYDGAIEIFKLNLRNYPDSKNARQSLANARSKKKTNIINQ